MFGKDLLNFIIDVSGEPRAKSTYRGPGRKRADERLRQKRKANRAIPDVHVETRQARRAFERAEGKRARSAVKRRLMADRVMGGSAILK